VSKTHQKHIGIWATRQRQPSLMRVNCCATSQVMPMFFNFCCMVYIQFFCGFPGFLYVPLISQCTACLGSLLSSIRRTCPSHLSLLSFMMRSIFFSCVCALTFSLLTLSFHEIPIIRRWNLWCAASSFFFCTTGSCVVGNKMQVRIWNKMSLKMPYTAVASRLMWPRRR